MIYSTEHGTTSAQALRTYLSRKLVRMRIRVTLALTIIAALRSFGNHVQNKRLQAKLDEAIEKAFPSTPDETKVGGKVGFTAILSDEYGKKVVYVYGNYGGRRVKWEDRITIVVSEDTSGSARYDAGELNSLNGWIESDEKYIRQIEATISDDALLEDITAKHNALIASAIELQKLTYDSVALRYVFDYEVRNYAE